MDSASRQLRQVGRRVALVLLLVVALVGLGAAARAETADAFVGESVVVDAGGALTKAAESVVKQGKFVPEAVLKAAGAGGVAGASRAAGVFQAGAILPALGAVTAFGVGTVIGSEICKVVGIEGCWYYGSEGADPLVSGGSFVYVTTAPYAGAPAFQWYWKRTGFSFDSYWKGIGGFLQCGATPPTSYNFTYFLQTETVCEGVFSPEGETGERAALGRWSMTNRELSYHSVDDPAIGNYAYEAPSDWPKRLAAVLANPGSNGLDKDAVERVGQHIASKVPGSGVASPYGTYVNVPDCDGLIYATCADLLEELGLEPHREDLNWSEVETTTPNEVRELEPAKSKEVEVGTAVKVVTNPAKEGMPILVPHPEPGETYDHYVARLNPALSPQRHDLDAPYIDTGKGPNEVVRTDPQPGTALDPGTTHKVDVSTNPGDAPAPAGGWSPPAISSIDMGPISGVPSPCTVFPFGLFCWVGEAMAQFNTSGSCPGFSAPVAGTGSDFDVTLCGETSDTIMGYLRPALLLAFIVGCGFLFARGTRAVGGD